MFSTTAARDRTEKLGITLPISLLQKIDHKRGEGETQGYYMIKNAGISGAPAQKENSQQVSTQFVIMESIEDYINKAKQLGEEL